MLLNNLFTYEQLEGDSLSSLKFRIFIQPEHEIFKGHFPGSPINPGVCQMEMVKEILGDYLGKVLLFNNIGTVKFINMWVPNEAEPVYMDLNVAVNGPGYKVNASIYTGKEVYFKLKGNIHVIG